MLVAVGPFFFGFFILGSSSSKYDPGPGVPSYFSFNRASTISWSAKEKEPLATFWVNICVPFPCSFNLCFWVPPYDEGPGCLDCLSKASLASLSRATPELNAELGTVGANCGMCPASYDPGAGPTLFFSSRRIALDRKAAFTLPLDSPYRRKQQGLQAYTLHTSSFSHPPLLQPPCPDATLCVCLFYTRKHHTKAFTASFFGPGS